MMAARMKSVEIVRMLIQRGANMNLTNKVTCLVGVSSGTLREECLVQQSPNHENE